MIKHPKSKYNRKVVFDFSSKYSKTHIKVFISFNTFIMLTDKNGTILPCTSKQAFSKMRNQNNPLVFLDISIDNQIPERLYIELFQDIVPKTTENFRQFCTGEFLIDSKPVGYKGTIFHRVIKSFMIQGGDFVNRDGTGCKSIYGESFEDEKFEVKHTEAGLLSMANSGPNSNGCQFFITSWKCPWLDKQHVVFGKVISSLDTVMKMDEIPTDPDDIPIREIKIVECGQM